MNYFFEAYNNIKYPNTVESKDPARTPIFTPSMYWIFSAKAKFPTNKLIVKPTPVNIETPYRLNQLDLSGICATPNLTAKKEISITPTCLPTNNPKRIPNGTGSNNEFNDIPLKIRLH